MSFDYSHLQFARPAEQVKTIGIESIPQRIFDGMSKYEDAARGFALYGFERLPEKNRDVPARILVSHRPADAQVAQIYRLPSDPESTELERLTHFDIGTGRRIEHVRPIVGEDWRGVWRGGGFVMVMDLDGSEKSQLWRYWEDSLCDGTIPRINGELDNRGGGRIERLTHDDHKYASPVISHSNKLMTFSSNKENGTDTLIYISKLIDSRTGAKADTEEFTLPSVLVTPLSPTRTGTSRWMTSSISIDDRYMLVTQLHASSYRPLYIIDISGSGPYLPELITLPGATEKEEEIVNAYPTFSLDPARPHLFYLVTDAYGDFPSVITYDIQSRTVSHITTPEPSLRAFRPIHWGVLHLHVTTESVFFCANIEGWHELFVLPLSGPHEGVVIQIQPDWEGGHMSYHSNTHNGKPQQLVLQLTSYRSQGRLAHLDVEHALEQVQTDEKGEYFISVSLTEYGQAQATAPTFRTLPPKLMRYKSFDGLDIPAMYYHPNEGKQAVPVVIVIHGGPASQATAQTRNPIHFYLLNEMNCAVIYPNVRGSSGYGKKFMAADDVEKREDSVKDIGALLDYIGEHMKTELDASHIAVMGGSYGGYMTFACLTHYSSKLACGVANCGVAHWPSFLRNTASHRQAHRRREYGDETDPKIQEFLERISPLNNASKIGVPLLTMHGETDSRIPMEEALRMWDIVHRNGVHSELMIGEKEGHGFRQKSVIEYSNAARIQFLNRFLLQTSTREPTK